MRHNRINDIPEDNTYVSRARQAIEDGVSANDEDGDKQAGDGVVAAPLDGLLKAIDIVHDLKNRHHTAGYETGELEKLEKALGSMIKQ